MHLIDNFERPSPSIHYSLESTSSGVCVKCTFLDTEASECVAVVVHRNLMKIESSHKFTRSDDIASGCIEGVNLEDYQVGVVEGLQTHILETDTGGLGKNFLHALNYHAPFQNRAINGALLD